jgi:2-polyprenyl-3-methyl-5-hydroxy-6-metoxy-1,4-benzoquinol methylase
VNDEPPVLDAEDVRLVIQRYRIRIAEHGPTLASLNSGSSEKQHVRHLVHASALYGPRPSVLDVGCGIGSFYEHLVRQGRDCSYTGYDIVPEYIEYCRGHFEQCHFSLRNLFIEGIEGEFDTVVMSQTLNNRYQHSDNVRVMQAALRTTFERARISISVDMLSTYADLRRPELFYYSPEEMFAFAKTLTRRVVLRHDYRPSEFCLQLFQQSTEGYVS